jgi:hypothetical protein
MNNEPNAKSYAERDEKITTEITEKNVEEGKYFFNKEIKIIKITPIVETIGKNAFFICENLTELIFEEGSKLETIGEAAFYQCENLNIVKIPNSVKTIGEMAFNECKNLTQLIFEKGSKLETIGKDSFNGCKSLTKLIFEEGSKLETIDESAFSYCKNLNIVKIPNSVKTIGEKAFNGCESLTKLIFEEGSKLETIGKSAFYYCENLNIVKIPNSVKTIGEKAFCIKNLLKVEGIKDRTDIEIGKEAFNDYNFNKKIEIDDRIINTDVEEIVLKEINEDEMISGGFKPKGLWYSFGTQWLSLCKDETYGSGLEILKNNFKLTINECNILKIKNVKEFNDFERKYRYEYGYGIDWKKVYKAYDGIEIYNENNFQYLFDKKRNKWYDTWDIGSGCIWKNCKITTEKIVIEDEDIEKYGDIREEISKYKYDGKNQKRKKKSSSRKLSLRKRKSSSRKLSLRKRKSSSRKRKSSSRKRKSSSRIRKSSSRIRKSSSRKRKSSSRKRKSSSKKRKSSSKKR